MDSDEAVDRLLEIIKANDYTPKAAEVASKFAGQFSLDSEVLVLAGNVLYMVRLNGDKTVSRDGVWDAYRRAASADPMNGEAWLELGILSDIEERFDDAEGYLRRSIELEPTDHGYAILARVLSQLGKQAEAIELIDSCEFGDSPPVTEIRQEILTGQWEPMEPSDNPTPLW
ncbi:hypothetical protein PHYC_01234 [Phycisphaerales bacterium]|nr:hypothetical protein PHYC_01234 [Phycisphaerales bacterium]